MSDLLLLLFNRLFIVSESPYHSFAHKNKRFTWKTKSKFPTLFPGKGETKYKMFVNIDQYSKQMHFYHEQGACGIDTQIDANFLT